MQEIEKKREALVQDAQANGELFRMSFGDLWSEYTRSSESFLKRIASTQCTPSEIEQNTAAFVWAEFLGKKFDSWKAFCVWANKVAENNAKKFKHQPQPIDTVAEPSDPRPNPRSEVSQAEEHLYQQGVFDKAVSFLSERDQMIITMRRIGCSPKAIAAQLGLEKVASAQRAIDRAVEDLMNEVTRLEGDNADHAR